MPYKQEVKDIAYKLDPECWVSYSGKPKEVKREMDWRRVDCLETASRGFEYPFEEEEEIWDG